MVTKKRRKLTPAAISKFIDRSIFQRFYLIGSITILGLTTILWSLVGSWIHSGNADQLANSYLTENATTFQSAIFPDQHTFLFKLPFFWLVQLLGASPAAFTFVTVLMTVLTVGLFAFILYRLQPRSLVIGTIYLALALVLLMIPAEPYGHSLLPINLAMLTTRNLEYIFFIIAVILAAKAGKWVSWRLLLALLFMTVLVASDKLFLSLGIAGAVLFLGVALIRKQLGLRRTALQWLVVTIIGGFGALVVLHVLTALQIFQLEGHNVASPYGVISSAKEGIIAIFYAVAGLFTNFGANPGFESRTIIDYPAFAFAQFSSPASGAYLGTISVALLAGIAGFVRIKEVFQKKAKIKPLSPYAAIALILLATTAAALGAFIISNHYFPADARYLSIVTFAGFICLATFGFKKKLPTIRLVGLGAVLFVLLIPAATFPFQNLRSSQVNGSQVSENNTAIAKILALHPVETLVGDYWRVLPIKLSARKPLTVSPLADCTTYRNVLTSGAWQPDLNSHSFAYLLSFGPSIAGFPECSLETVVGTYGKPDSSVVISGTAKEPKEILLFYDKGIRKTLNLPQARVLDTILPVTLDEAPFRYCAEGKQTTMNFVAHEDDDILFMNPDVYHDLQNGNCIRSVFFTAGDAGLDAPYWLGRQKGAESAYASMLNTPDVAWTERIVEISPNHFATIANPRANRSISLIFLHLPDGNMNGRGFSSNRNQSLAGLFSGQIPRLQTVDKQSTYSSEELKTGLVNLLGAYLPNTIRTQSADAHRGKIIDHSDHTAVGHFTSQAVAKYLETQPSVTPKVAYYLGYPIATLPENVASDDLGIKVKTFTNFSHFDSATCHSLEDCDRGTVYGKYLRRQYTNPF